MRKKIAGLVMGLFAFGAQAAVDIPEPRAQRTLVAFETDKGSFVIELREDRAPKHVGNFKALVNQGFYDGVYWHRVIPGFVAQAGDPTLVGRPKPNFTIEAELDNDLKHERGAVGMARLGDPMGEPERPEFINSASTQFYITLQAQPYLDGRYTVFGHVARGMDVVDELTRGDKIQRAFIIRDDVAPAQ